MELRFVENTTWDDHFFEDWFKLYSQIYPDQFYLSEDRLKFKDLITSHLFPDEKWTAVKMYLEGEIVARALVVVNQKRPEIAKLGFIEFIDLPVQIQHFFKYIETLPLIKESHLIKTPINFHFFYSYRLRIETKIEPFMGEPQQPDYYQRIFEKAGYQVIKTWNSYLLNQSQARKDFPQLRKILNPEKRLKIKYMTPWNFKRDIQIVYHLFMESYQSMPEFEPITFEQFYFLYKDYKYLINPLFNYLIYADHEPVGFSLNLFDHRKTFLGFSHWEKKFKNSPMLGLLKLGILIKMIFERRRLLIIYVGRRSGDAYKGVQALVSKQLAIWSRIFFIKDYIASFQADDSPAKRSFDQGKHYRQVSTYVVLQKKLK